MRRTRVRAILFALLVAAAAGADVRSETPLRCARDVARAAYYGPVATNSVPFRFVGRVTYVRDAHDFDLRVLAVEDDTGAVTISCPAASPPCAALVPGDTAELAGLVCKRANVKLTACRVVSSGPPVRPADARMEDLLDGRHDFRLARFTGTLRDVAKSETAPRWLMLVVCSRRDRLFISVPDKPGTHARLLSFLGRRIAATGVCVPQDPSRRLRVGRTFKVADGAAIDLAEGQSDAPAPDISAIRFSRPAEVLSLGRHSATGRVIAVWQGAHALLRLADGDVAGIELARGVAAPRYGDLIHAVGLPESDLYHVNLANVSWRRLPAPAFNVPTAIPVSARSICTNAFGYKLVKSGYHGRSVTLRGVVRSLPNDDAPQMHVECDGLLVPVDASALPGVLDGIEIGSALALSGTCVVTPEASRPSTAFPRMDGFTLVLRRPSDVAVESRPSWWTPRRLTFVIGGLLVALVGVIVRSRLQKRTAARLARLATDLKVGERTRLAVELHDSLAQNLTGVSLEIDTASKLAADRPAEMHAHLDNAARTLKSCRDELRNCLWDLRGRALEEATMDSAIRQTLAPHVAGVDVAVRFNVPRERISDNTAHAILRIVRELAVNAIRHGRATKLWIAGGADGDTIRFSVRDNGCGFDPAAAPGFAEGHYGLVGISERVEALEGEFSIDSAPGKGAKASVTLGAGARTELCITEKRTQTK